MNFFKMNHSDEIDSAFSLKEMINILIKTFLKNDSGKIFYYGYCKILKK